MLRQIRSYRKNRKNGTVFLSFQEKSITELLYLEISRMNGDI